MTKVLIENVRSRLATRVEPKNKAKNDLALYVSEKFISQYGDVLYPDSEYIMTGPVSMICGEVVDAKTHNLSVRMPIDLYRPINNQDDTCIERFLHGIYLELLDLNTSVEPFNLRICPLHVIKPFFGVDENDNPVLRVTTTYGVARNRPLVDRPINKYVSEYFGDEIIKLSSNVFEVIGRSDDQEAILQICLDFNSKYVAEIFPDFMLYMPSRRSSLYGHDTHANILKIGHSKALDKIDLTSTDRLNRFTSQTFFEDMAAKILAIKDTVEAEGQYMCPHVPLFPYAVSANTETMNRKWSFAISYGVIPAQ